MSLPPRSANTNFMQGYSTMPTETSTTTLETLLRASREYGEDILQAAPPRSNTPPSAKPVARIGTTKPEPPPQVPFKTHEAPPWLKLGSPERKARAAESPSFAWRADTTAAKPPTPTPKPPPRPLREQVVEEPVKYAIRGPKRVELGRYRQGLWGPPSRNALYGPGSMIASLSHNHAVSYKLDAKDLFLRPQARPPRQCRRRTRRQAPFAATGRREEGGGSQRIRAQLAYRLSTATYSRGGREHQGYATTSKPQRLPPIWHVTLHTKDHTIIAVKPPCHRKCRDDAYRCDPKLAVSEQAGYRRVADPHRRACPRQRARRRLLL